MSGSLTNRHQQDNPVMHQRTAMHVKRLLRQKPHAILLSGAEGSGKKHLAQHIAGQLLDTADLLQSPRCYIITPNDKNIIPIEDVRRIREITTLKEATRHDTARVVCLFDVHTMVDAAHHALLKLLEEPPRGTVLIMTTHSSDQLPATVLSRVSVVPVLPIDKDILASRFPADESDANRAFYLSSGNTGLYQALLAGGDDHPYVQAVQAAKRIVGANTYDRLRLIEAIDPAKDPENASRVLVALERLLSYAFFQKPTKANHRRLLAVVQAIEALKKHCSRRLVLADLFLEI